MVKQFFQIGEQNAAASSALLLVRLVMGTAFIFHGWGKIQSPFGWMPEQAPMHIPPFFQSLSALAEFGGGIALVLGVFTVLVSAGLVINMSVATYSHLVVMKNPFISLKGGGSYELALVYLVIAVLFFIFGPGKFSLDYFIFGVKKRSGLC
ncbi:MAG: DoxX family protein [Bacteroidetes bacterium]|nr:DoxX family protein [Bacteroidota bacterium]